MSNTRPNAIEKRIEELYRYTPYLTPPDDLNDFWEETLHRFAEKPFNATVTEANTPFTYMYAQKITFEGFDDTPIHGWFILPNFRQPDAPLPCVVMYHGYTGSKGLPEDFSDWLLMGVAVFTVDVRGQGGETGNHLEAIHGMAKGWMSQSIIDRDRCYNMAIAIDCIRAVEWVATRPEIDPARIAISGVSQGGGLALQVAALNEKVALTVAHIPNMCHMDFGLLNSTGSIIEISDWLSRYPDKMDQVLDNLRYFDNMYLAKRITSPVFVSVGLKDTVCMPETVFAAFNQIEAEKELHIYPFIGHTVVEDCRRKASAYVKARLIGSED